MSRELLARIVQPEDLELAIRLTQQAVRIPSINGDEGPLGKEVYRWLGDLGFEEAELQEVYPGRYNATGVLRGRRPGPTLVLTGHLDNKPVCYGWDTDPFSGTIVGGRLYGHGVMDMKAAVCCQIAAVHALRRSGVDLAGAISFAAVADHMGAQQGSIDFFKKARADMAILGELSDNRVYVGHRGRYYFDITTLGRAAHTYRKADAISAINKMTEVVRRIDAIRYYPKLDPETARLFGEELYMAVGRIYGGLPPDGPSMIPDRCTIRVDTRPQPGVPVEEVQAVIEAALSELKAKDPELKTEMMVADVKNWHWIKPEEPIVRLVSQAAEIVKGEPTTVHAVSWLGDTASFGRIVPTVIFGPGREPIYMPNEYLDLKDIEIATKVYALTAALALDAH